MTDARRLIGAVASSRAGDVISAVALVVVVAERTRSPGWLAVAGMARLVPYAVLGAPAGRLVGRWRARTVAIVSDLVRAGLLGVTTALVLTRAPLALIVGATAGTSVVGVFHRPAFMALVPTTVDDGHLGATNASFAVVENVVGLVGPLVAGLAVVSGVPALAFAFDAATFAVSAALLCAVSATPVAGDARNRGGRVPSEAWTVVAALAVAALVYGHETVLLALYAQRRLGSTASLTVLEAAVAGGGVLAAWPAARIARGARSTAVLLPAVAALGLPLATLAVIGTVPAACALLLVEGAANVVVDVVALTLLQRCTSDRGLAAATGVLDATVAAALLTGVVSAPLTVGAFGLSGALLAAGLMLPVVAATAQLRQMRTSVSSVLCS